jgi:hypothetical protein
MDLGDYTMVKERGRNDERGMKIARGLDIVVRQQGPANGANVEIFSNSFCMH